MFDYHRLYLTLTTELAQFKTGPLCSDHSVQDVQAELLRRSFYKKLVPNETPSAAMIKAGTEKFLRINRGIAKEFTFTAANEAEALWWDYFRDHTDKAFNSCEADYSLASLREYFGTGPGAALGADATSFYTKMFDSKLTATSEYLLTLYRGLISESDTWAAAEMQRFQKFGFEIRSGNRLFFVLKDASTVRTCCTEPGLNMVLQKALAGVFEKRLEECYGINLRSQPDANRRLAFIGSRDDSFATIDLESASDSISWALIRKLLRGRALACVSLFRSPTTTLPSGVEEELNMVSTMGNGFTFPLMTLLFCCAVRATYDVMGYPCDARRDDFAVFGDDIIVRKDCYAFITRMLNKLGFVVNDAKSFSEGPFRESCGHDYFRGVFCRGVYVKSLETVSRVYSLVNRLARWSAYTNIPLVATLTFLIKSVPKDVLFVPRSEDDEAGVHVPFKFTVPKVNAQYWFAYRKLVPRASRRWVPLDENESRLLGYRDFNSCGHAVSYLGGFARNSAGCEREARGFYMPRAPSPKRYKVTRSSVPWWDWVGPHTCHYRQAGMTSDRWEAVWGAILA